MTTVPEQARALDDLLDDLDVAGRPGSALTDAYETVEDLLTAYEKGAGITEIRGVGRRTSRKVTDWIEDEHPDIARRRYENGEGYCIEFTTDHGLPEERIEEDTFYFAFVCPRCEETNPLKGDPTGFKNRPFRCERCQWVSLLVGEFLEEFAAEQGVGDDA